MTTASATAQQARQRAVHSDWFERVGRAGLAARGALYALLGVVAMRIAFGQPAESADKPGALRMLAEQPAGGLLLVATAVGLACYAAWRFLQAATYRNETPTTTWARRTGFAALGMVYLSASLAAVAVLRQEETGGGGQEEQARTAEAMGWPGGRLLVGAVALGVAVAAGWNLWRGLSARFERHLCTEEMTRRTQRIVRITGRAGFVGRSLAFATIAWFLFDAAWSFDPAEPIGLDQSLREVAGTGSGTLLIVGVGVGFMAFALFSLAEARWRELPVNRDQESPTGHIR
jgi:uncharacterized membrane protein YidH (DUF202 family)